MWMKRPPSSLERERKNNRGKKPQKEPQNFKQTLVDEGLLWWEKEAKEEVKPKKEGKRKPALQDCRPAKRTRTVTPPVRFSK